MKLLQIIALSLMTAVSFSSNKSKHIISVNPDKPEFNISVAANPSTGYSWTVKQIDENLFEKVTQQYQRPNSKLIGAGGKTVFTFRLKELKDYPKDSTIVLFYAQPWEPKKGKIKKFTIKINTHSP